MSLPTWAIGDDYEDRKNADSYVVHLHAPHLVIRVTQRPGAKLLLTHAGSTAEWQTIEAAGQAPAWFELMRQAAQFWIDQVDDPQYAKQPPEILSRPDFTPPRLLLCDSDSGQRTFLVHTAAPFFAAEFVNDQWRPVVGDVQNPLVTSILNSISPPRC